MSAKQLPEIINFFSYNIDYRSDNESTSEFLPRHPNPPRLQYDEGDLEKAYKWTMDMKSPTDEQRSAWKMVYGSKPLIILPYTAEELRGKILIINPVMLPFFKELSWVSTVKLWVPHVVSVDADERVAQVDMFLVD